MSRKPFFGRKVIEAYKRMKARELRRAGRPVPSCLLPTETTPHDQQRKLPFTDTRKDATDGHGCPT